jgi:hypothetical protein
LFGAAVVAQTKSNRFPFIKNGMLGFIDGGGREVIPAQFGDAADAASFQDGIANVGGAGGWGYIDESGKFIVEPKFWWADPFSEGFACVLLPGEGAGYGFIDETGRLLIQGLKVDSKFHDGLAPVLLAGKYGYLGTDMKIAVPPEFDIAFPFSEGMAQVEVAKKWGYIDKTGKIVIAPHYDAAMPFSDGMARVDSFFEHQPYPDGEVGMEGQTRSDVYIWGFIDPQGTEIIPPKFLNATNFSEGYAFAMPNDASKRFGIIDKSGNFVHEPAFDEATEFSESLAAVRVGEKWGYVDHSGSWVIPPSFTHATPFSHGLAAVVFSRGRHGYIDKSGSVVWQNETE